MKSILKLGSIALGLPLMLTTALCYGQAAYFGPAHNVIYWDGDSTNLQSLAKSSYTDVIVDFVTPDWNCNLGSNGYLPGDIKNSVQTLHSNGKTVLVSLGGSQVDSGQYASCDNNMPSLVSQLVNIVKGNGFDGVDIDFEDTSAFKGAAAYDGVEFLTNLTDDLYSELPQWSTVTHAPATPYWLENFNYDYPPYAQIYWNTSRNTNEIAWFNNQTYNNCTSAGGPGNGGTDCTAQDKIADYEYIVNSWGVKPINLVMGLPVSTCGTGTDADPCTGDGYIPLNDGTNNDMRTVITTLYSAYPNQFGGVMGWNYSLDLRDQGGSWGSAIWGALYNWQTSWVGDNWGVHLCLDSELNSSGSGWVHADSCNGGNYQNWRLDVNAIKNAQTGQCLDSNFYGEVYTLPCNGGNYQNWEFYGWNIYNRQTKLCLRTDNSGAVITTNCTVSDNNEGWTPYE